MALWRVIWLMSATLIAAGLGLATSPFAASDAAKVLEDMEAAKPGWLPDLGICPVDAMPARETLLDYSRERCAADLEQCVRHCQAGNANDCYVSALILQEVRHSPISDAFFLRACTLGIVSGCINRAAGMDSGQGGDCAIHTYDMGCDRSDPWACTMLGFHLARGIGIAKDTERARRALSKSCRYGGTDQACGFGRALLHEIGE
jgi:hypothetical protein